MVSILFITSLKPMRPDFTEFITEHTNAIKSWKRLNCNKKIVVAGLEDGTSDFCHQYGLIHEIPDEKFNLPIVRSIIECGQKHANDNDFVIYINADIVLDNRFVEFLELVLTTYPNLFDSEFYITSQRQNVADFSLIDFEDPEWMDKLVGKSEYEHDSAIDIMIHRKGSFISNSNSTENSTKSTGNKVYKTMPDFVIGRCVFDTWLNITGCKYFPISINATGAFPIIHQYGKYHNSSGIIERDEIHNQSLMSEEEKESWNYNQYLFNNYRGQDYDQYYSVDSCALVYKNGSIIKSNRYFENKISYLLNNNQANEAFELYESFHDVNKLSNALNIRMIENYRSARNWSKAVHYGKLVLEGKGITRQDQYKVNHILGIVAYYANEMELGRNACLKAIELGNKDIDKNNLQFYP